MMTWTLVILSAYAARGIGAVAIPNYPTAAACMASAHYAQERSYTLDAYCVAVPKEKP